MIRFRMEWQDAPGVRDAVLARTWCRLVIEAEGRLVTEAVHVPSESLRGGIYGSAFPLCQWIVENWWFLLNESYRFPARYTSRDLARTPQDREWVQRHSLLAAREGHSLPDLTLHRDEQKIVARWMPDGTSSSHPYLRFTGEGETYLEVADAERGLAEAVQAIMDRLDGMEQPEVQDFRKDWAAVVGVTEQERRLCESAARLGIDAFDPDELTDSLEDTLSELVTDLDAPLRDDFLDAAHPPTLRRDMDWLHQAEALAANAGKCRKAEGISCDVGLGTAHNRGYECAKSLRKHLWPENGHDPVKDLDEALVRLGWAQCPSRTMDIEPECPLEAALTRSDEGAPVAIIGDAGQAANRFRLVRTVFLRHFTHSGRTHRRLATEAHSWEQRASRAFAAEFLAPAAGLSKHLGGRASPSQIDQLADHYGVSSQAIGHQIENHRLAWIQDS